MSKEIEKFQSETLEETFSYEDVPATFVARLHELDDIMLGCIKRTQEEMATMGACLLEAKANLPHGQFTNWYKLRYGLSKTTAWRMMQVAQGKVLPSKTIVQELLPQKAQAPEREANLEQMREEVRQELEQIREELEQVQLFSQIDQAQSVQEVIAIAIQAGVTFHHLRQVIDQAQSIAELVGIKMIAEAIPHTYAEHNAYAEVILRCEWTIGKKLLEAKQEKGS